MTNQRTEALEKTGAVEELRADIARQLSAIHCNLGDVKRHGTYQDLHIQIENVTECLQYIREDIAALNDLGKPDN